MSRKKSPLQSERTENVILLVGRPFRLIGMSMPLLLVSMGEPRSMSFVKALWPVLLFIGR